MRAAVSRSAASTSVPGGTAKLSIGNAMRPRMCRAVCTSAEPIVSCVRSRTPTVTSSLQFPVEGEHLFALLAEMFRQAFGKVDRTMPAAGAADADRHVRTVFRFEARQPRIEERLHVAEILDDVGLGFEPFAHG